MINTVCVCQGPGASIVLAHVLAALRGKADKGEWGVRDLDEREKHALVTARADSGKDPQQTAGKDSGQLIWAPCGTCSPSRDLKQKHDRSRDGIAGETSRAFRQCAHGECC